MPSNTVGRDRIAVALDSATTSENLKLVRQLAGRAQWYKIGLRQFYRASEPILDAIRAADAKLFLDLKLHDIPQTVRGAAESLAKYSPELVTVHAFGGRAMIEAAVEGFADAGAMTRVLAVTVLTSLDADDLATMGSDIAVGPLTENLTAVARDAGAAGIVCSPLEVEQLRTIWADALFVTPGIRPPGSSADDQKRVSTPAAAVRCGAGLLVVGRPIRDAADPIVAFDAIADSPLI